MTSADITPTPTNPKLPTQTPTYKSWASMRYRCTSPKEPGYKNYGGRGIRFTLRWMRYENFHKDMGERLPGTTLDRIDVNKGYFKDNCRWADAKTQARNRTNNRFLTINGVKKCVTDWEIDSGLPPSIIKQRLKLGWPLERLFDPPQIKRRRVSAPITSFVAMAATAAL